MTLGGPFFFESFERIGDTDGGGIGRSAYRVLAKVRCLRVRVIAPDQRLTVVQRIKALLSLLKVKSLVDIHERLTLTLDPSATTLGETDRLVVRLDCASGITKVHRLFYTPVQPRLALYSKTASTHSLSLSSALAHRLLQVFGKSAEEVCLDVKRDEWALTGMSEAAGRASISL